MELLDPPHGSWILDDDVVLAVVDQDGDVLQAVLDQVGVGHHEVSEELLVDVASL